MKGRRFYVRVSSFSLGTVLMSLLDDDHVEEVCVSLEDGELLVSFSKKINAVCSNIASKSCDKIIDKD